MKSAKPIKPIKHRFTAKQKQFEEYVCLNYPSASLEYQTKGLRDAYWDNLTQMAWEVWQAAYGAKPQSGRFVAGIYVAPRKTTARSKWGSNKIRDFFKTRSKYKGAV